jgi:hypothetical protein
MHAREGDAWFSLEPHEHEPSHPVRGDLHVAVSFVRQPLRPAAAAAAATEGSACDRIAHGASAAVGARVMFTPQRVRHWAQTDGHNQSALPHEMGAASSSPLAQVRRLPAPHRRGTVARRNTAQARAHSSAVNAAHVLFRQ